MLISDSEFAARSARLLARIKAERAAEKELLRECHAAIEELLASGEPLTERNEQ